VESNAKYVQSKLNFVDLAGSERLSKTQVRCALIGWNLLDHSQDTEVCWPLSIALLYPSIQRASKEVSARHKIVSRKGLYTWVT